MTEQRGCTHAGSDVCAECFDCRDLLDAERERALSALAGDFSELALWSARYALWKRQHAAGIVSDILVRRARLISPGVRKRIVEEIEGSPTRASAGHDVWRPALDAFVLEERRNG